MKIIKHKGNGQTYCVGCLAAGRQPLQWDSWIIEIQYDSGKTIGCFCGECFKKANEYLRIKSEGEADEM
jgi:hypothetical protein